MSHTIASAKNARRLRAIFTRQRFLTQVAGIGRRFLNGGAASNSLPKTSRPSWAWRGLSISYATMSRFCRCWLVY